MQMLLFGRIAEIVWCWNLSILELIKSVHETQRSSQYPRKVEPVELMRREVQRKIGSKHNTKIFMPDVGPKAMKHERS